MQQIKGLWTALVSGYVGASENAFLNELLTRGGMVSMLNTAWLIICALGFGGLLERTGVLDFWLRMAMKLVRGTGSLISTTVATCLGANVLTADQFIAVALPGRMFRDPYEDFGLSRLNLSRTLEDSATITSALIPWNTCGAYMAATLGVATTSYAPFAFFNIACPLLAVAYGLTGFAQKPLETEEPTAGEASAA